MQGCGLNRETTNETEPRYLRCIKRSRLASIQACEADFEITSSQAGNVSVVVKTHKHQVYRFYQLLSWIGKSTMEYNCTALKTIISFESYVNTLRNVTTEDLSAQRMWPCRQEICAALYGTGSADVSGIGVCDQNK